MATLIDRDELYKALSAWDWQDLYLPVHFKELVDELPVQRSYEDGVRKGYEDAVRHYAKLALKQWIPVSERLPKAGEYVGDVAKYYLVQNEFGDMLVARYTHSGYWEQIYQYKPCADEIVAWMPLPDSYKVEQE